MAEPPLNPALLAAQSQPVPLRVAASIVFHQLNRSRARGAGDEDYLAALNSTCLALSQIADIYCVNPQGKRLRIPSEALMRGAFEGGGERYRTLEGNVYAGLSMRRIDVMEAITVLQKASKTVPGAATSSDLP